MTHPALVEDDLYDGPDNVTPITVQAAGAVMAHDDPPRPTGPKPKSDSYLAAVSAAMDILSYRVILLLSVLVAGGLFGLATWYPDPWRLGAASAFSVIVVAPLTFFYARR